KPRPEAAHRGCSKDWWPPRSSTRMTGCGPAMDAKDQAEALVGDAGLVATLTDWGMAHVQPHSPADSAWLRPASPDMALQGVLVGHQARLARGQELLLEGHKRLADAQARFGVGMNGRFPAHLVSVVSGRAQISE